MLHHHGRDAVPEIVQGIYGLGSGLRALVCGSHERASQLNHMRQVIPDELVRKMEHVGSGEIRLSVLLQGHIRTEDIPVSAYDRLRRRVPDDNLPVRAVHSVELVKVKREAGTAPGLPERLLTQAAHFAQHIGRIVAVDDIDLVARLVGVAKLLVRCEFCLEQADAHGVNDLLHILNAIDKPFPSYTPPTGEASCCRRRSRPAPVSRKSP